MEAVNKNIINIQEIEPQLRHQTIFDTFEQLENGESLTIHNNHDPQPVYYQLLELYGETFNWKYIQSGPEWWDILVTKIDMDKKGEAIRDGERVLDIPSIENHQLKHQTIFQVFEELQPSESFIIHNDHDPKPVYFQLQAMHGDVFTWEYIKSGPQVWEIRVTKKGKESNETVGEIVANDITKAEVFKKFGIDFCCNGNKTVAQACSEMGLNQTEVEKELQKPITSVTGGNLNFSDWDLGFLADYIVNTHHKYVRKYLPEIEKYSNKVAKVHGTNHPELLPINELVEQMKVEFFHHMKEEETKLFPMVKEIVEASESETKLTSSLSFKDIVITSEKEHEDVGYALGEIRRLSNNYALPEDACASYTLLFKMLEEFENDTFIHIHLENNMLFSKAQKLEESMA